MTKQLDIDINKNTEKAKEKKKIIFDLNVEGPRIAWNEDGSFPYQTKMDTVTYELEKHLLQIELLKVQSWIQDTKQRVVVVFEGRDAAGKGGTIKRFMEHLNPRGAKVVALEKPNARERNNGIFSVISSIFLQRGNRFI